MSLAPIPATGPKRFSENGRPYLPHGSCLKLMQSRAEEVLLSGPAGTGKSRAALEKLHLSAEKYPGMRGLMLRKTRESLTEAALKTFEAKVVPAGHPILSGPQRNMRQIYRYPNGSEIVVGGLDKSQKVMSTEYDMAYIQEAIECTDADWENVTTRLRNGVMPYQQLIADTNPDAPHHWLYQRCLKGETLLLESRHEDNPTIWDSRRGEPTPAGSAYIAKLDRLTGVRYKRLRLGLWVAAEGTVYEGWDPAVHMVDRFPIPDDWPRFWAVDFGFVHPFVCQFWAMGPDGDLYRYREIYHTRRLVEDHARQMLAVMDRLPSGIVCDWDAEDRATLEHHLNMLTSAAHKSVSDGIQAVASRLRSDDHGRPRLHFLRDSLVERDPELEEARKPCCTEEEFPGYVWNTTANRKKGEEPLKQNDDGMDAMRYLVAAVDGLQGVAGGGAQAGQSRDAGWLAWG